MTQKAATTTAAGPLLITLLFQSGILFVNFRTKFKHSYKLLRDVTSVIIKMCAELNLKLSLRLKLLCEFRILQLKLLCEFLILQLKLLCEFLISLIEEVLEHLNLLNHVPLKLLNLLKLGIMTFNLMLQCF